jgi:hypothetical protein
MQMHQPVSIEDSSFEAGCGSNSPSLLRRSVSDSRPVSSIDLISGPIYLTTIYPGVTSNLSENFHLLPHQVAQLLVALPSKLTEYEFVSRHRLVAQESSNRISLSGSDNVMRMSPSAIAFAS